MKADAVQTLLKTSVNSVGQPVVYPQGGTAEVTALLIDFAPGEATGWHSHPVPVFGYLLSGEMTVYGAQGEKRIVRAGEASLESVDLLHNGINEGGETARLVVFILGQQGVKHTVERTE